MVIIVVNRSKGLVPEIPQACVVKIVRSPLEIFGGKGVEERLVAQKTSEKTAVTEMLRRISGKEYGEESYRYFVEIDTDVSESLIMKIAVMNFQGQVSEPIVVLEKGNLFACREGVKTTVHGTVMSSLQDCQRMKDMLEIARFVGYEL